jgi:hypothetical protein
MGHSMDGAVWALVVPRQPGHLRTPDRREEIVHCWLRFHPRSLGWLFPPATVAEGGNSNLVHEMRMIAAKKFTASWHSGLRALIPEPGTLTVDLDTTAGVRRFFGVETNAGSVKYVNAFEQRGMPRPPPLTAELAVDAFDQLWKAFDESYAMFVLRPEVDWNRLRDQFRPKARQSKSTYEFAAVCGQMLETLRDLHVGLTLAGLEVPVYDRPRQGNSNPAAFPSLLGLLRSESRALRWTVHSDKIGFVAIENWSEREIPVLFDQVLEQMRDTRGLIIDVRRNGGGSEPLAQQVAGRFVERPFTYAFSQVRSGARPQDLSPKRPRQVVPRGPWRYDRPVLLLIGERCMSSNESFIDMMSGSTNVTTMGNRTCGSSGNPTIVNLPLEMTVRVPKWIDYRPDGTPLDERGITPQIVFTPATNDFDGVHDGLLASALEQARRAPLPAKPIQGPAAPAPEGRATP